MEDTNNTNHTNTNNTSTTSSANNNNVNNTEPTSVDKRPLELCSQLFSTNTDTDTEEEEESFYANIPFHLCMEFLPLRDVLSLRLTCHSMAEAADAISPDICLEFLKKKFRKKNAFLLDTENSSEIAEDEFILKHIIKSSEEDNVNTKAAFDQMMKCFQILYYLPGGKYGKYCLPVAPPSTEKNKQSHYEEISKVIKYPSCDRNNNHETCCTFQIPDRTNNNNNNDDDDVQIINPNTNKAIDINRFYNTCVPNLPPTLRCPFCLERKRTLLLELISYKSSSLTISHREVLLSYTPETRNNNNNIAEFSSSDDDSYDNNNDNPNYTYEKFTLSIHCTHCKMFHLIKPAAPCNIGACQVQKTTSSSIKQTQNYYPSMFQAMGIPPTIPTTTTTTTNNNNNNNQDDDDDEDDEYLNSNTTAAEREPVKHCFVSTTCASKGCINVVPCQSCTAASMNHNSSSFQYHCQSCKKRFCRSCMEHFYRQYNNINNFGDYYNNHNRRNNRRMGSSSDFDQAYFHRSSDGDSEIFFIICTHCAKKSEKKQKKKKRKNKKDKKKNKKKQKYDGFTSQDTTSSTTRQQQQQQVAVAEESYDEGCYFGEDNTSGEEEEERNHYNDEEDPYDNENVGDEYDEENQEWDYCD